MPAGIDRPEPRVIDLILSDGDAEILEPADGVATEQPHVPFECDGETCVLILYGRLTPHDAVSARWLSVADGKAYLAATFGDRFVGG